MTSKDISAVPDNRKISHTGFDTLHIPKNMSRNKSSPDIYDELLPQKLSKDQAPSSEAYIQSLKRISEHHQVIMVFVIGGITHSEIK